MANKEDLNKSPGKKDDKNNEEPKVEADRHNDDNMMDRIEIANDDIEDAPNISTNTKSENNMKYKGAAQFAKEFFKILNETININYNKNNEQKTEEEGKHKSVDETDDNPESTEEVENIEERKVFDRKISNIIEYFFNTVKNKPESTERVRRKSSCFWAEQSPQEKSCDEEGIDQLSPQETLVKCDQDNNEKMETLKEFLTNTKSIQPTTMQPAVNKSPRKSLEILKNTNAKIQRKIFSKRSTSSEERQSIVDFFFNTKERRDSGISKLLNRKQKSLDETQIYGINKVNEGASCSVERKDSLVEYLFKKDKSVSFSALLRRFSQDSAEISFIDESPEMKTRESLVDIVKKYMDSFESYVSKDNRRDSGSKTNLFKTTNVTIAKPDDFQLTPDGEVTSNVLSFEIIRKDEARPKLQDMGTSCDLPESSTQDSFENESPGDVVFKEVRKGYWIKSDQLEELRKCAEIIINEVQSQVDKPKTVDVNIVIDSHCQTDKSSSNEQNISGSKSIEEGQELLAKSVCEQCMIEALLGETKILPGTLETTFEYDPTISDESSVPQTERLCIPYLGRELEMINESFETEDSPQ